VLRSSSGAELLESAGLKLLLAELLPLCDVVTPNIDEAAILTGLPVTNRDTMRVAAERLHRLGARNVVITGGHLSPAEDLLSIRTHAGFEQQTYSSEQLSSPSTHGTGCAFATAVACGLATGSSLRDAVQAAKGYVFAAIRNAYPVGKGRGPIHHLYRLPKEQR
nr:bifunctional hydroxymethylpyrimidine kinase/phosphomethylpyrimidine kinase [Terriglobales bacterium]